MRQALRSNPQRQKVARGASIPAPIEGWDAITPLAQMKPTRAIQLDNFFPQPGYIELRRGHRISTDTNSLAPVESLMAYSAANPNNDKLFSVSDGSFFDTTDVGSTSPIAGLTGFANSRWHHVNFATSGGQFLWTANGASSPRMWDGSAWATPAITGTGITASRITNPWIFKGRLWFCMEGSLDAGFLPVDSIQGTAELFPLAGVFSKGGYLMAGATWALDGGDGPDDYIAFISSRGQVAIYTGSLPSGASADFVLRGVYDLGSPLGRRCVTRVAGDLALICQDGAVPLSKALITERGASANVAITKNIQPIMNQSARDYGSRFGWQLISYPKGTRAILNVPVAEGAIQHQYVMNTVTGAWCRFLGENANCWEVFQDRLFFGGNDGRAYEADVTGVDAAGTLTADVRTAFNYFGTRGKLKRWPLCRPLIKTDGAITPAIGLNVDFSEDAELSAITDVQSDGALYGEGIYGISQYGQSIKVSKSWENIRGVGYCASIHMRVSIGG